jgi:hypothetical protein
MATEGIMALPQGMGMQGEQAQQEQPTVTSADSYDAAMTALGMVSPGEDVALKEAIRQNIGDLQLSPAQLDMLIQVFEYISQNPSEYKSLLRDLVQADALDEGDMPEEYDPEFIGAMLAVLQEMRQMQGAGAQEPMNMGPTVEGLQPIGMASGGLADVGQYLAAQGRYGDTMLAHITPEEAALLKRRGGSGTINPVTGLPEFFLKKLFGAVKSVVKGVVNVVKDVLKSPVGRILGTIALAAVLGPAGVGLSMGTAAGLAGAGTTLMAGGSIKEALISGALGYVGGGGTIMGVNPVSAVGGYLPGAAGSALNTGLSTGLIGAGIGKISGMSTQDALRMGLMSGASAAALQGLKNNTSMMNEPVSLESGNQPPAAPLPGEPGSNVSIGGKPDITAIEATGPAGTTGTARDLLAGGNQQYTGSGLKMPAMGPSAGFDAAGNFRGDYSLAGAPSAPVPGMEGAIGTGLRAVPAMTGAPGMGDALGTGLRAPVSPATMASGAANYSLSSVPQGAQPTGFIDKMVQGGKNLYNEYLSPTRAGLPADAGIIQKYGPLALAGTTAIAATGGMKSEPVNQNPAFNRNYTGSDYMRDNPDKFSGGLSSYTKPTTPDSPIVPTPSYGSIPIGPPSTVVPMGVTNSPGGVAQPYNVAGLYGIPIIYGPDGQPRRMAKGGDATMTQFPRKTGPINGPGTGTSDDIPAMLSDGEFVFTAKAVRNAGGGSRRKGAARMYKLMKKLEGGAVKGK